MFTGLIETTGILTDLRRHDRSALVVIDGVPFASALARGESIAVNGVCLTVVEHTDTGFAADAMAETLDHTTLGALPAGAVVNLERALPADGRLGGHIVQGHVDATSALLSRTPVDDSVVLRFTLPPTVADLVVYKGSITLDGVSLTVSARGDDWFEVSLIPQTQADTRLGAVNVGDAINVESDILARHVQQLLHVGRVAEGAR